jgi:RNA polymerase sigma-70 factor, ECF subfamily
MTPLELQARTHLEAAREIHPDVHLDDAAFLECVARHAASSEDRARFLATVHGADLFLACACAEGDSAAIARVTRSYSSKLRHALRRQGHDLELVAEVEQLLYLRLLVAAPDERPQIASYNGQIPLGAWLRVIAMRLAIDVLRRESKHAAVELQEGMARAQANQPGPGLARALDIARAAFEAAFLMLDRRQKRLLRLHFLEGMSLEHIGARYDAHRATVARWIASAREQLLDAVRRGMAERLQVPVSDVDSLLVVVRSRLDLSIARFLT